MWWIGGCRFPVSEELFAVGACNFAQGDIGWEGYAFFSLGNVSLSVAFYDSDDGRCFPCSEHAFFGLVLVLLEEWEDVLESECPGLCVVAEGYPAVAPLDGESVSCESEDDVLSLVFAEVFREGKELLCLFPGQGVQLVGGWQ